MDSEKKIYPIVKHDNRKYIYLNTTPPYNNVDTEVVTACKS